EEGQAAPRQEMAEEKGREERARHPQGDGGACRPAGQGDDKALGNEASVDGRALDRETELAAEPALALQPLAARDAPQHERADEAERADDGRGPTTALD